ncbi:hypothetical protein DERF_011246 [Dermatophagoides farinae]|uniref:Uncharacterized protein n=1 Tax=Dermatophagoides farinae TaxID=6954 RepID=A0A922HUL0_DERFA|nr:hypothetical protein DERF_011246 [Dermatophagoides farinae]
MENEINSTGFTPSQLLLGHHERFECDTSDPIDSKLIENDSNRTSTWREKAKSNLKRIIDPMWEQTLKLMITY